MIQQATRNHEPIPDFILNKPELILGLDLYYVAFNELGTERQLGMAAGPIPFTSILKYAEHFEFDEEQTEQLLYFIRKLDAWYLKKVAIKP